VRFFFTLVASLLCLHPPLHAADVDWMDPAFLEADMLESGSGLIRSPSPEVLPGGVLAASVHRLQGKVNYGILNFFEAGLTADLDGYNLMRDGSRNQLFFARARLLRADRHGLGLSLGLDGLGPEDFGLEQFGYLPKAGLSELESAYAVLGGSMPFYPSLCVTLGLRLGRYQPQIFGSISKVILDGLMIITEYDGQATNLGARLLLSPRVKLDLSFTNIQMVDPDDTLALILDRNVRFGITYSEPFPAPKKKGLN